MTNQWGEWRVVSAFTLLVLLLAAPEAKPEEAKLPARIRVDAGHPWRPPFGLERVGRPLTVVIEFDAATSSAHKYSLIGYLDGRQIAAHQLETPCRFPSTNRVTLPDWPTELVLSGANADGKVVTLARETVHAEGFEAEAIARSDKVINPVDLGTILVPHDWLLLAAGQKASITVAAICRTNDLPGMRVTAWFDSLPRKKSSIALGLKRNIRVESFLHLPPGSTRLKDILHVVMADSAGAELWRKEIPVMQLRKPPRLPAFGATDIKLRYDAPISLLNRDTGVLTSMPYANGWAPDLSDVIVSFPNGSRFVFWRGTSYVPFWAGRHNTGMAYEWAERPPPPEGFSDSVEPLMDKELRYGRVEIRESTSARIHVRWCYQSCDFNYKVFGDAAVEDFYFYPDGMGTRVLSLRSAPEVPWELSEFIILTPQSAYPFEVLPSTLVKILPIDGTATRLLSFPAHGEKDSMSTQVPRVYRIRLHKEEARTAIYFNPDDTYRPEERGIFGPFFDKGYMVTPAYWGSHWPLARGKTTGAAIDNRIFSSPTHNSFMTWATNQPAPLRSATLEMVDALGKSKPLSLRRWAWLIGMTEDSDERVVEWARSFAQPPSLELEGARLDIESYVPERRALRLVVEGKTVAVVITPSVRCVNPVFELLNAPKKLTRIRLGGRPIEPKDYAWDGRTLWLNASLDVQTKLQLDFR